MTRAELVLAALAASGGAMHTPVQIQKLLFLLDKKIPASIGGPHFNFQPYDYGPFDPGVYREVESLAAAGNAEVVQNENLRIRRYNLTPQGLALGEQVLSRMEPGAATYVRELSKYVRSLTFPELVSSIYQEYPEMKANSVFRG